MSLAGNLSDLSLPELLQVVALSRKTGALEICSEQGGVAWLGLRDGGIVRVALEDGDLERERVLKRAGLPSDPDSDIAEATLWDAAVQAILSIFEWTEGDFTFEPLDDPALQWRGPSGILLRSPLSPEFLALEGARLEDENASAAASARTSGAESPIADVEPTLSPLGPLVAAAPAPRVPSYPSVLIFVDAELALLERLKRGLQTVGTRIHIFQNASDALQRYKQYVVRGETPALIVGSMIEDPIDAHQGLGWRRFAGRLLGLSASVRLVVIARSGENVAAPGIAVVRRPDPRNATDSEYQAFVAEVGRALAANA